ncbi:MAG: fumarylacetoacetate hydrolase family protein [Tissierellia bacterium]|nr:fumarylacetoacetate hydrolase family protein [Tissierellia bacterium]
MKLVNYFLSSKNSFGLLKNDNIFDIPSALELSIHSLEDYIMMDCKPEIKLEQLLDSEPIKSESVILTAPIQHPRRVICVGKNYVDHALEVVSIKTEHAIPKSPIYFCKTPNFITTDKDSIELSKLPTSKLDYEVELGVVIGKKGINIPLSKAQDYILGLVLANDFSARDLQSDHQQWFKGKNLDGFCPIAPELKLFSPNDSLNFNITCSVNGEIRQSGFTKDLIFPIPYLISNLSMGMTLLPGDIILTGTPSGVAHGNKNLPYLKTGDKVVSYAKGIGSMTIYIK